MSSWSRGAWGVVAKSPWRSQDLATKRDVGSDAVVDAQRTVCSSSESVGQSPVSKQPTDRAGRYSVLVRGVRSGRDQSASADTSCTKADLSADAQLGHSPRRHRPGRRPGRCAPDRSASFRDRVIGGPPSEGARARNARSDECTRRAAPAVVSAGGVDDDHLIDLVAAGEPVRKTPAQEQRAFHRSRDSTPQSATRRGSSDQRTSRVRSFIGVISTWTVRSFACRSRHRPGRRPGCDDDQASALWMSEIQTPNAYGATGGSRGDIKRLARRGRRLPSSGGAT